MTEHGDQTQMFMDQVDYRTWREFWWQFQQIPGRPVRYSEWRDLRARCIWLTGE